MYVDILSRYRGAIFKNVHEMGATNYSQTFPTNHLVSPVLGSKA